MFGYGYLAIVKTLTIEISRPYHNDFYFYQAFQILVFFKRCIVRNLLQHTGPYPEGVFAWWQALKGGPNAGRGIQEQSPGGVSGHRHWNLLNFQR